MEPFNEIWQEHANYMQKSIKAFDDAFENMHKHMGVNFDLISG